MLCGDAKDGHGRGHFFFISQREQRVAGHSAASGRHWGTTPWAASSCTPGRRWRGGVQAGRNAGRRSGCVKGDTRGWKARTRSLSCALILDFFILSHAHAHRVHAPRCPDGWRRPHTSHRTRPAAHALRERETLSLFFAGRPFSTPRVFSSVLSPHPCNERLVPVAAGLAAQVRLCVCVKGGREASRRPRLSHHLCAPSPPTPAPAHHQPPPFSIPTASSSTRSWSSPWSASRMRARPPWPPSWRRATSRR